MGFRMTVVDVVILPGLVYAFADYQPWLVALSYLVSAMLFRRKVN